MTENSHMGIEQIVRYKETGEKTLHQYAISKVIIALNCVFQIC